MKSLNRKKSIVLCLLLAGLAGILVLSPAVWASSLGVLNLTEENALQSNDVRDVYIYDITKDSTDYTTWYDDSSKSWWHDDLLLWNKLGSDAEVTNSEIGPDGLIIGEINYLPGKFDNGFKPEVRTGDRNIPDNYIRFDGLNLGQKGCIEFWFQPDWVSGGHIRHILSYGKPGSIYLISLGYNDWQNRLALGLLDPDLGGYDAVYRGLVPASTPEWSTTEPFHIAIVWDGTAANNADKVKLFLNGIERGTQLWGRGSPTFADWGSGNNLYLATRYAPGDWNRHHWEGSDGIMDNIKVWDYPKTDFEDRFVEHSGDVRGQFPTKSYLVCTDLGLDIVDSDSNELWMRFEEGTGNALQSTVHNAVKALDGKVFVGSDTGLYEINFVDDMISRTDSNGIAYYNGNISERNDGKGYGPVSGTGIVNTAVNGIALTTNYVFVGTDGGVSLIDLSGGAVYDDSGNACYAVYITDSGELIYHDYDELLRKNSFPGSDFTADDLIYLTRINAIVADDDEIFVGVEGGGVVVVNSTTFNISEQVVKSSFDDSQPYFWNKMEIASGGKLISEIGTDLSLTSTNYDIESAMFNNGWDNNAESTYAYAPVSDLIPDSCEGAVEFYWVPDDDSDTIVGYYPPVGSHLKTSWFFSNGATASPINNRWYFEFSYRHYRSDPATQYYPSFNGYFRKRDGSGNWYMCEFWRRSDPRIDLPGDWKAGDRVHIALAWHNQNVILGRYICALWVNGELLYGFTEPTYGTLEGWRTTNPTTPYDPTMRIGDSRFPYSSDEQLRGPMDNVKTYDFAKDDWGDRHLENGSVVKIFAGESGNVRALALADDNLYIGTNDGNDGGGISVIDTAIPELIYNWTLDENEELVDYDITSLSFWRDPHIANNWILLVGTENGASVILAENQAPIADAGPDQMVHPGAVVTLDGSASSDPDEDYPLTYSWQITSKPEGSMAELSDPCAVNPSFIADMLDDYIIELIVTDSLGAQSAPDDVLISTFNTPPVADAGPDQAIIELYTTVQLDGSKSYDDEGDDFTYLWTITQKPAESIAELDDPCSATPAFVAGVHGDYVISLVVTDIFGAVSDPDSVTVSFTNVKPVADAGVNQAVVQGDTVYLDGSGSYDANFDLLSYSWSIVSKPVGSLAELSEPTSVAPSFVADLPGEYIVSLVVNDSFVYSDAANVTILAITCQEAAAITLVETIETVNELDPNTLKNENLSNALTNKINAVLKMIDKGLYEDALDKLENDILQKTNGCADTGEPDNNDWIRTCEEQSQVYSLVMETIELLENLII